MHSWEEVILSKNDEKRLGREYDSLIRIGSEQILSSGERLFVPENAAEQELYDYYQARAQDLLSVVAPEDWEHLLPSGNLCGTSRQKCTKNNFFEFKIIRSSVVNAFAVPGGYVFFYTSILKNFDSESALMSVLGHEVGHVVLHHSRDRIVKATGASVLIDALLGDGAAGILATLGTNIWLLGHSQDNESESDEIAFTYTHKLGISSKGLGDFFSKGLNIDANGNCIRETGVLNTLGEVLSTHPPSCERVNRNNVRIKATGQNFPKDKNLSPSGKTFKQLVEAAGL
jgi:predicted Zn-dependent protease